MSGFISSPFKSGFSLVELSIVLVILGLLVGGVLSGQSLIRAAELRAVSTEYARYTTAAQTFRDKYFSIPGDFRDATRFWQRMNGNADCVTNSSATTNSAGACDGNGDGNVLWDNSGGAAAVNEMHQFWRHLALAGLIEGTYSGTASGGTNSASVVPGTNSPRSKLSNAGWGTGGGGNCGSNLCFYFATAGFASIYGNYFVLGAKQADNTPLVAVLKPEEAWNIDTKSDDGRPATGKIMPLWQGGISCTTSTSLTDTSGTYNLSNSTNLCAMYFVQAY